jgi:hypothetical protein
MDRWGVLDHAFLGGVPVEPGQGREPASDRRWGPAELLELACVQLDVGPGDPEQVEAVVVAPAVELAQVECVRLAGPTGEPGQEPGEGEDLRGGVRGA